jgi:hypothetical protein
LLPQLTTAVRNEIKNLYETLDAQLFNLEATCHACGDCCDLPRFGHELWLSNLELAYLLDSQEPEPCSIVGVCPYRLEGKCSARVGRALGCRVFHCDLDATSMESITEAYLEKMKKIATAHGLTIEYGELISSLSRYVAQPG